MTQNKWDKGHDYVGAAAFFIKYKEVVTRGNNAEQPEVDAAIHALKNYKGLCAHNDYLQEQLAKLQERLDTRP